MKTGNHEGEFFVGITEFSMISIRKAGNNILEARQALPLELSLMEYGGLVPFGQQAIAASEVCTNDDDEAEKQESEGSACFYLQGFDQMRDVEDVCHHGADEHGRCSTAPSLVVGKKSAGEEIKHSDKGGWKDEGKYRGEQVRCAKMTGLPDEKPDWKHGRSGEIDAEPPDEALFARGRGSVVPRLFRFAGHGGTYGAAGERTSRISRDGAAGATGEPGLTRRHGDMEGKIDAGEMKFRGGKGRSQAPAEGGTFGNEGKIVRGPSTSSG